MKRLVAPHIEKLTPYVPGKPAQELERELGISGAVKLASNECPLGPSPLVLDAVRAAAAALHRYPDDDAYALRQRLAERHGVHADEICLGHGSNQLIDLIARAFATPEEHAVLGHPSFSCYRLQLSAANVPFSEVPMRAADISEPALRGGSKFDISEPALRGGSKVDISEPALRGGSKVDISEPALRGGSKGLFWDLPRVLAAVRPETKLVFLDNPGNPISTHIPGGELRAFLRELPENVVAVVDEAYVDFVTASDYASALELRRERERLLILRTFSKAYGLAGLRLGYAIGPAVLLSYMKRVGVPFSANSLAQVAALAALQDRAHLERCVTLNATERARLTEGLTKLGLAVAPSQTNFVCVHVERPAALVYEALLQVGVIVRPFGPPLDRHLRISVGLPEENDRLLALLPGVLAKLPNVR